jgi:TM2 domain-containing membrane protein YozV
MCGCARETLIGDCDMNDATTKSIGLAYLFWFLFGGFGIHRFYLGRTKSAVAMLLLFVIGTLTAGVIIGVPMLAVVLIWWLVDAFLIPGIVGQHNMASQAA